MADLLLVNPLRLAEDPVESELMTPYFPLGILYVAAAAREAGYTVAIHDAMFDTGPEAFAETLERERPRVVGFGVLATVRAAALRMAATAKQHGALVVMGGPDPTARPETYLTHLTNGHHVVDAVSLGESEAALPELLRVLMAAGSSPDGLRELPGVAYRDEIGQVATSERPPLIQDLDDLPLPARDLIDWEPYRRAWRAKHGYFAMSLIATRGCPYQCTWCQKIVFGRSFRPRSPEAVAKEMRLIKTAYKPDALRIVDDVMGVRRHWVKAWRDAVLASDAAIPFECLSRVDLVDEELLGWLKDAGCRRIAFGAESGSQSVLDAMRKGTTVEQARRAASLCRELGIETYFYMMVGYPGETWHDLEESVALLRETRPNEFSTTIAYPLPGTAFYDQVRERIGLDAEDLTDWAHTAENRLLFGRDQYSTLFYRRVIRWYHHEWEDARQRAGDPAPLLARAKTRLALGRDRLLVRVMARLPGLGARATGFGGR